MTYADDITAPGGDYEFDTDDDLEVDEDEYDFGEEDDAEGTSWDGGGEVRPT